VHDPELLGLSIQAGIFSAACSWTTLGVGTTDSGVKSEPGGKGAAVQDGQGQMAWQALLSCENPHSYGRCVFSSCSHSCIDRRSNARGCWLAHAMLVMGWLLLFLIRKASQGRDYHARSKLAVATVSTQGSPHFSHSSRGGIAVLSNHQCAKDETLCGATPRPWFQVDHEPYGLFFTLILTLEVGLAGGRLWWDLAVSHGARPQVASVQRSRKN
jgi:hypothetical protein